MSLFDRLRGDKRSNDGATIYAFTFKIASGATKIPPPMIGAYVVAYSTGDTPMAAAERSWQELRTMGYAVEDMKTSGGAISSSHWDAHIAERWPEFANHFPAQKDLLEALSTGVIFGPFAGFENPETAASVSVH